MKISREGIVLIKSFEGFRPRAIRREDGDWVIGYGHTLSAREGATVSEPDAELLLRYDLLPVEKTVNHGRPASLNQHQFDALVSFAFSVGLERFRSSDVLDHLTRGATAEAADAMMGWPEPATAQASLRRRAAERALFGADPTAPVAVADLLVAPIETIGLGASADPIEQTSAAADARKDVTPHTNEDPADGSESRSAAVSALLGESDPILVPRFAPPPPVTVAPESNASATDTQPSPANDTVLPVAEPLEPSPPPTSPAAEDAAETRERPSDETEPYVAPVIMAVQRYTPYAAPMVGPLPFLPPAREPLPVAQVEQPIEAVAAVEAAVAADLQTVEVAEPAVVEPFASAVEVEPLVLNGADDLPTPAVSRQPWTVDERVETGEVQDAGLFGEDLSLTQGGAPIIRHGDIEFDAPASFDWSETGAFVIMGAVGLTAFGAAMAAFRLASEQSGGDETTIIAWVLAVIGAACVGVSSFNLYRRWGLPGGDN